MKKHNIFYKIVIPGLIGLGIIGIIGIITLFGLKFNPFSPKIINMKLIGYNNSTNENIYMNINNNNFDYDILSKNNESIHINRFYFNINNGAMSYTYR